MTTFIQLNSNKDLIFDFFFICKKIFENARANIVAFGLVNNSPYVPF